MKWDIHDRYEQEADRYLAAYGLRVAADMLPAVRQILRRETRHEADARRRRGCDEAIPHGAGHG